MCIRDRNQTVLSTFEFQNCWPLQIICQCFPNRKLKQSSGNGTNQAFKEIAEMDNLQISFEKIMS